MVSLTASILDRITGSSAFSRGSLAVRSSWLSEARTVAIVRVTGWTVVKTCRSGEWMTCDLDNARTSITVTVFWGTGSLTYKLIFSNQHSMK